MKKILAALAVAAACLCAHEAHAATLTLTWDYTGANPDSFVALRAPAAGSPLAPSGPFAPIGSTMPGTARSTADATVVVGAAYCYQVVAQVGATPSSPSNTACGMVPNAPTNLRLSLTITDTSPSGKSTVSVTPGGVCSVGVCSFSYPMGQVVTLVPRAAGSAAFSRWIGACAGASTVCQVAMSAPLTVGGEFRRK